MNGVEGDVVAMRRPRKRSWTGGSGAAGPREQGALLDGFSFSPDSQPRVFWNSRRRSRGDQSLSLQKAMEDECLKSRVPANTSSSIDANNRYSPGSTNDSPMLDLSSISDRRKSLFEPLDPSTAIRHLSAEELPPPDFDELLSYPKGWLVGKKRKLVNVDVVESMRRIAVREMNRKDREIEGLNEQLEEDAKCVERLQEQLLEERSKRAAAEREKAVLESQVEMLMEMLNEEGGVGEESEDHQKH